MGLANKVLLASCCEAAYKALHHVLGRPVRHIVGRPVRPCFISWYGVFVSKIEN